MGKQTKVKKQSKLFHWQENAKKGGQCQRCKRTLSILSVDHIVPLWFLESFDDTGMAKYEDEDNFQFLCHPCNKTKGGQFDKSHPKTKEIILRYL